MFWTYVAFAQYLIIWAGNLPEETSWFLRRDHGIWAFVVPAVGLLRVLASLFHAAVPAVEERARTARMVASLLLASQLAYTAWVIVPIDGAMTLGAASWPLRSSSARWRCSQTGSRGQRG